MKRRPSEAERLRRHNEELRYALEHNLTVLQARQRLAQFKMTALEERVHPPLKPAIGLCGTESPATDADPARPQPHYWWLDQ